MRESSEAKSLEIEWGGSGRWGVADDQEGEMGASGMCSLGGWLDSDGCHQTTSRRQRAGSAGCPGPSGGSSKSELGTLERSQGWWKSLEVSEYGALQQMSCPGSLETEKGVLGHRPPGWRRGQQGDRTGGLEK